MKQPQLCLLHAAVSVKSWNLWLYHKSQHGSGSVTFCTEHIRSFSMWLQAHIIMDYRFFKSHTEVVGLEVLPTVTTKSTQLIILTVISHSNLLELWTDSHSKVQGLTLGSDYHILCFNLEQSQVKKRSHTSCKWLK